MLIAVDGHCMIVVGDPLLRRAMNLSPTGGSHTARSCTAGIFADSVQTDFRGLNFRGWPQI